MRWTLALAVLAGALVAGCAEEPEAIRLRAPLFSGDALDERLTEAARAQGLAEILAAADVPPTVDTLEPGTVLSLEADVPPADRPGHLLWRLRVPVPLDAEARLTGAEPSSALALYRGMPGQLRTLVAQRAGSDAFLSARVDPGEYTLLLPVGAAAGRGGASVSVSVREPGAASDAGGAVPQSGTNTGRLGASQPRLPDGTPYQGWTLYATAGDQVTVTMVSDSFPAHLLLLRGEATAGRVLEEAASDGGPGGVEISDTLSAAGTYTVLATAGVPDAAGPYEIQFEVRPGPAPYAFDNASRSSGRYALLVEGLDDRGAAYRDVLAVRDLLRTRFGFDEQDIVLLTGDDASRANVANGVLQHLDQAGPEGVALLFISGSGITLPRDVGLRDGATGPGPGDRAILLPAPGGAASLLLDEEVDFLMASLDAGRAMVILDTSFGAPSSGAAPDGALPKGVDPSDSATATRLIPPLNFIGVEPGVVSELSPVPLDPNALRRLTDVPVDSLPYLSWVASSPAGAAWVAPGADGASLFTRHLVDQLTSAPQDATLWDLQQAIAAAMESTSDELGLPATQLPVLTGPASAISAASFFDRR